ncbi:hypothetical protein TSUD_134550 [Trifolium subterraneum]|uniref:Uncharacterized protein n=1 Tax=Trifolium subterraneum TaxID=3900 RepID=A0A2Z6PC24_TRISU|nr:hypothetical protein TSUD_134550 [Trifolium subterraneum]
MLGEHLQFLVSKLVACYIPSERKESRDSFISECLPLLHTFTLESDPSMHDYVKELEPFPELKIFDEIRKFHEELSHTYSIRDHILKSNSVLYHAGALPDNVIQQNHRCSNRCVPIYAVSKPSAYQSFDGLSSFFVKRSCYLPPRLLLSSLQALHKKLLIEETFQRRGRAEGHLEDKYWHGDHEIVHAVWTLVHMCGSDDASGVRELVSDFISRVGAGDPHSVVFQLPGKSTRIHLCKSIDNCSTGETSYNKGVCISDELLVVLIKLLMKYLMDDSVKVVDTASQTIRGILSTERGRNALQSFDSYQRSLVEGGVMGMGSGVEDSSFEIVGCD